MKNVKKLHCGFVALMAVFALAFAGCAQSADLDEEEQSVVTPASDDTSSATAGDTSSTDTSGATELKAGDSVTVNVGETKTVYVSGKTSAEFTQAGLTITSKGDGLFEIAAAATMTDATVSVNFNDGTDTDDGVDVTVYVYDPNYTLNLTIDSAVAASAATITVAYGGIEEDTVSETVTATYTAGASTATAKLKKEYANDYDWFSPVKVTVKDSEGAEVIINQSVAYFCYSATTGNGYLENNTIAITAGSAELTFTINFEGFTAKSVTGAVYTKVENDFDTTGGNAKAAEVTVADGGASATFTVLKSYTNDSGWFQVNFASVVVKDSDDNTVTLSSGNENGWFEYKDGMSTTLSYSTLTDADYTNTLVTAVSLPSGTNSNGVVCLKEDLTMPTDAKAFKLVYTVGDNDAVNATSTWITIYSNTDWANETKLVNAWESGFDASAETFTVYITDSSAVAAFIAGNFYIAADSASYTGTITITYAK